MSAASSVTSSCSPSSVVSSLSYLIRRSSSRGHADHGWLNTYHSFSFASYYDSRFNNFYCLRVLNEDRVIGGEGFGTHGHANYEIFSYIVNGALLHRDSMNNKEIIPRGGVQFTTAGTGIQHSEYNANREQEKFVHFLQIWVSPNKRGLKPRYSTIEVNDQQKEGKLKLIVSGDQQKLKEENNNNSNNNNPNNKGSSDSAIFINNDINVYASILKNADNPLSFSILAGRAVYIHLIQDATSYDGEEGKVGIKIRGQGNNGKYYQLKGGDGLMIERNDEKNNSNNNNSPIENIIIEGNNDGEKAAEFILFDIKKNAQVLDDDY